MKKGYELYMVVANVDDHDRILVEQIEGYEFDSIQSVQQQMKGKSGETFRVILLEEFTMLANDEELNLDNVWLSYVYIKENK